MIRLGGPTTLRNAPILLAAAGAAFVATPQAAMAQPVEYVRVCDVFGTGFSYIPGTEMCADDLLKPYRIDSQYGIISTNVTSGGTRNAVYGIGAFGVGQNNVAFGNGAWSGGDPFSDSPGALFAPGFGDQAPRSSFTNLNTTAIGQGARAGAGAVGQNNATAVGQEASANALDATAVGQGAQANAVEASAFGQAALATGAGSLAAGQGSQASAGETTAVGHDAQATFFGATAIGAGARAVADPTTAVGFAAAATADEASAFGAFATASGVNSTAIGRSATASGFGAVSLGFAASATSPNSVAVGNAAAAVHAGSSAIGAGAFTERANQMVLGTSDTTYTARGISSVASRAAQVGPVQVVTSDAAGNLATSPIDIAALADAGASFARLDAAVDSLGSFARDSRSEARRGIAAAMAMVAAPMPSAPGATSWTINTAAFQSEWGGSASLSHRLDFDKPLALSATYGYGGGDSHSVRFGVGGEF